MRTWVKLYTEILRDPKMAALPDHRFRVCVNLFALAGQLDEDGRLGSTEDVAFHLRLGVEDVAAELQALAEVGVTMCKKGVWWLKNWEVRNGKAKSDQPDSRRERVQKWRQNKVNGDAMKREGNASVTPLPSPRNGSRKEKNREEEKREELTHAGVPPAPAPEPAQEPDAVKELAAVFERKAGIKLPTPAGEKGKKQVGVTWWHPLRQMAEMANGQSGPLLAAAVEQMRSEKLTIASPQSVLKVFTSLHGERVAAKPVPSGPRQFTPEEQALRERLRAKQQVTHAND